MIRVRLPSHLRAMAGVGAEVTLNVPTSQPMPGIQPTFGNPSVPNPPIQRPNTGNQKIQPLTEQEKLELLRQKEADGGAAGGAADAGDAGRKGGGE